MSRTPQLKAIPMTAHDVLRTSKLIWDRLDVTTIRFIMMGGSFFFGFFLILFPHTFRRHGYEYLAYLADEYVWATVFLLHAFGVIWRFLDHLSRPNWAFAVNIYGFFIWAFVTVVAQLALGALSPFAGFEFIMLILSFLAVVKTGLKREVVTL